ncbi:MAG: hypothetical protein ACKVQS_01720 [Fimbriimonadaceae bacterium]
MSKPLVLSMAVVLSASSFGQSQAIQWTKDKIINKIKIFGERRVTVHFRNVSGDRTAYDVTNDGGFGDRRITDLGYLKLEGRDVLGWLNFDANVQDARFIDPQSQRYRLWYDDRTFKAEYGDIQATLPTRNRFITVNNSVNGFTAGYKKGPLQAGLVRTETRGEPRSVSIAGNNSAGPFYLQSNQIVRGSERVEVDGVLQLLGQDYTIDYDLGAITFLNRQTLESKIIPPTSTIVATYESFNFSGSAGRIEGLGINYSFGKLGTLGLTGARQVTGSSGGFSTRLEKYQGFGAPSTPYFLQFQPLLSQPIVIRVDGVLQAQDIDWRLDPANSSIFYFNRFMPSTSQIDVLYTPQPSGSIQGDREVFGLDYTYRFGKNGSLAYTQATGRSTNTPTPSSGTARGVSGRYQVGPWNLSANFRDVPSGYVSIQSATFSRNERVNDWRASLKSGKNGLLNFGNINSNILSLTNGGSTFQSTRFTRTFADYALTTDPKVAWPITLSTSRNETRNQASRNKIDSIGLSTNRTFGRFTTSLSVDQQKVSGTQSADLTNLRLQTDYATGSNWGFTLGAGLNKIRSNGQSGSGHDYLGAVNYRNGELFTARLGFSDHDSGSVSSVPGLDTGYGNGYGGNGFTSGTGTGFGNGATSGKNTSLSLRWQPSERLGLRANGVIYQSNGSVSSNSKTESASLGMDYDLGGGHFLGGDFNISSTNFSNSALKSTTTTATGFMNGRFGNFGYRTSGSILLSGGSSTFAQDNVAFDLFADYKLGSRQSLGLSVNYGNITGYLPQTQLDWSLVYKYQIWQSLALNVRYRFNDNKSNDLLFQSGAYRARTLDFEFAFNFGR